MTNRTVLSLHPAYRDDIGDLVGAGDEVPRRVAVVQGLEQEDDA